MIGNENIDQVDSFTDLASIISNGSRYGEHVKSRTVKAQGVFFTVGKT